MKTLRTATTLISAVLLTGSLLALTACNTVEGAGQDIKAAGSAISDTAQKVKQKIEE